ncbi:MAG: methyltransferase domain-containing protein [Dongiaceae bacterium]
MGLFRSKSVAAAPKPLFKERFKAWWEGYELPAPPVPEAVEPQLQKNVAEGPSSPLPPLEEPIVKVQMAIWGDGNSRPGSAEYVSYLVKPFALNPSMSILDFGCGLGGGTRTIAKDFDVYVTGYEPDRILAEAGKALSIKQGLDKKAAISHFDPKTTGLKTGQFDCVFCADKMHLVPGKQALLTSLEASLKIRGQITIIDTVLGQGVALDDPRLGKVLGAAAQEQSLFWSVGDYEKAFRDLKFDLRIGEDITERYRKLVTEGWDGFVRNPEGQAASRNYPDVTVAEAEFWQRRLAAYDAGLLRIYRFYAIKMGSSKTG